MKCVVFNFNPKIHHAFGLSFFGKPWHQERSNFVQSGHTLLENKSTEKSATFLFPFWQS